MRKYLFLTSIFAILGPIAFTFQNFTKVTVPLAIDRDSTTMNDALISALEHAEQEQKEKQVALNVTEEDLEKAVIQKGRSPTTIQDAEDEWVAEKKAATHESGDEALVSEAVPQPTE